MISVEEAQARILKTIAPLGTEVVFLGAAGGRTLAGPVVSLRHLPPWDNSAMDGYGVRAADVHGASPDAPVSLPVRGVQLAGGEQVGALATKSAVRIMTGAPIPAGVDAVVMRELCDETQVSPDGTGTVTVLRGVPAGEAIRRCGEDVTLGEVVAHSGTVITPGYLNLLASAGHATVSVSRRPKVAILASGDELTELGAAWGEGDIPNSNAHALAAAVEAASCEPRMMGIARDSLEDHIRLIDASADADVLLTIGGVSMGTHDFVRPALEALDVPLSFWKVALRPGKPLAFARRGPQLIFGLPGNPVSSLVGFELFVRPALLRLQGRGHLFRRLLPATLVEGTLRKKPDVAFYARGEVSFGADGLVARLSAKQGSGQISGLARANALVVAGLSSTELCPGDPVQVMLLDDACLFSGGSTDVPTSA